MHMVWGGGVVHFVHEEGGRWKNGEKLRTLYMEGPSSDLETDTRKEWVITSSFNFNAWKEWQLCIFRLSETRTNRYLRLVKEK